MPGPPIAGVPTWAEITAPPADGDDASISAGAAPLRPTVLQILADRDAFAVSALHGALSEWPEIWSEEGDTDVWVRGFRLVLGSRLLVQSAPQVAVPLSGLALGTWAYLYAYDSAGTLAFEVSATAPDATLLWKSGGTSHRYLCSLRVLTATSVVPFRRTGRLTRYMRDQVGAYTRVLTSGGSGAFAAVPLQYLGVDVLPPHARMVELALQVSAGSGALLREKALRSGTIFFGAGQHRETLQCTVGAGQTIEYSVSGGAALTLDVTGWEE